MSSSISYFLIFYLPSSAHFRNNNFNISIIVKPIISQLGFSSKIAANTNDSLNKSDYKVLSWGLSKTDKMIFIIHLQQMLKCISLAEDGVKH